MKATIKDNTLVLEVPLTSPRPSASGKTKVIATTGGFITLDAQANGKPVKLNLTATIPNN